MTQETTPRITPAAWRETLYLAAINCSHVITDDSVILHRDPERDGSALSQMADRLAAEAVPGGAADERSDREIMLEWDEHYKFGLTNGTPFLSIVVNFARATARAAVAAHIAGQSQAAKAETAEQAEGDQAERVSALRAEPAGRILSAVADLHEEEIAEICFRVRPPDFANNNGDVDYLRYDAAVVRAVCVELAARCRAEGGNTSKENGSDLAPTTSTVSAPEEVRDALERIKQMTDADDPESYRCDDREGCLDTVFAVASEALRTTSGKGEAA